MAFIIAVSITWTIWIECDINYALWLVFYRQCRSIFFGVSETIGYMSWIPCVRWSLC